MKLRIDVELDNSAFEDNPGELRQILAQIPRYPAAVDEGTLKDSNGNRVGSWKVED